MHLDPFYFLDPVFRFVDRVIADYGDLLFVPFAYGMLALLIWVLSGGLRRKFRPGRQNATTHIIIIQPPAQPPPLPPALGGLPQRDQQSGGDGGGTSFAE
jgi:hypothetical protein